MPRRLSILLAYVLTVAVLCIGALSLLGFLLNIQVLHTWPRSVGMSLPSSVAFVMLGIANLLLISCLDDAKPAH